jgi:hypothetical protein
VGDRSALEEGPEAFTVTVAGWLLAKGWSQPGMVATGTRAELAKNRMNMGSTEASWAVWGSLTASPTVAYTQVKAS